MPVKYILSWLILLVCLQHAAHAAAKDLMGFLQQPSAAYWVLFSDKAANAHDVNHPHTFLSARAISRRQLQGIAITETDLPVSQGYIHTLKSIGSIRILYTSRWFNGALLQIPEPSEVSLIEDLPFVQSVEMVRPLLQEKRMAGTEKLQTELQDADTEDALMQITQLNGQYLHEQGFKGDGKLIAVLDAGFTGVDSLQAFSGLREEGRLKAFRDFADINGDLFDVHLHGTYVLSVMTADLPGMLTGVAPEASYVLLRTEDIASEYRIEEYNWLAAAEFADSLGADIINSSLGYTQFEDSAQSYTYADMDGQSSVVARAASMAVERGMLVVASAGNYGDKSWYFIATPADACQVISVGAVDDAGLRVAFSSAGPSADGRLKPEVLAMGRGVIVTDANDSIRRVNGTSFSAPLVAGLAACLWQKHPTLTVGQLRTAILESSHLAHSPDNLSGHGIPDFKKADERLQPDAADLDDAMLYPNPFYMQASISLYAMQEGEIVQLKIYNTLGQLIQYTERLSLSKGHNNIVLDHFIKEMKPGLYHFCILSKDRIYSLKGLKVQ